VDTAPPTFEEWIEYCFTQGSSDFVADCRNEPQRNHDGPTDPEALAELVRLDQQRQARVDRFASIPPRVLAEYLTRLFESPAFIASRYSDEYMADGVWHIFGLESESICIACQDEVPLEVQRRMLRSIATIYRELFDPVCCRTETAHDPDTPIAIKGAIYMIWDMDVLEHIVLRPNSPPAMTECGLYVIETILTTCRSHACIQSALHGIGHAVSASVSGVPRDEQFAHQLQHLVDNLLATRELPAALRDYAQAARRGDVV